MIMLLNWCTILYWGFRGYSTIQLKVPISGTPLFDFQAYYKPLQQRRVCKFKNLRALRFR